MREMYALQPASVLASWGHSSGQCPQVVPQASRRGSLSPSRYRCRHLTREYRFRFRHQEGREHALHGEGKRTTLKKRASRELINKHDL